MKHIAIGGSIVVFLAMGCGQPRTMLAGGKPVEHWLQALQDPDAKVRKVAVTKLGNVGTADPAALPAILSALKDPDADVRGEVILALMKFGTLTQEEISALTEMKDRDADPHVRALAIKALEKLQSKG